MLTNSLGQAPREVQVLGLVVPRIGGGHKFPPANRQQIILAHDALYPLVVHRHAAILQFARDARAAQAPAMLESDLLHHRPHFGLLQLGRLFFQASVKSRPAHPCQITHPLHTQLALQLHYFPDLVVNASPPACARCWRRASIFRKAPLKKSTSKVLSANASFSLAFSSRSATSRSFATFLLSPAD